MKISQFKNEIQAKNNFIENKFEEIRVDEKFVLNNNKEREIYINKIEEKSFYKFHDKFDFRFQDTLAYLVLEIFFEKSLDVSGKNIQIHNKYEEGDSKVEKIFERFKEKFSKFQEFIRCIKDAQNAYNTSHVDSQKIKNLNLLIEDLKKEAESLQHNSEINYENFFYPILKSIKLMLVILAAKIRIEQILVIIEKVNSLYNHRKATRLQF